MASTSLSFSDKGSGFPIVFIHGFCENKDVWNELSDSLQSNYRIISPDLPGFGASPLNQKDTSIEFYADAVKNLLDSLKIDKCIMIGHSLGGYVTLSFAEKYPSLLKGFGLFHSTAFADSEEKKQNRNKAVEFVETNGVEPFIRVFFAPLFAEINRVNFREKIDWLTQQGLKTSKESIIAATKAMRDRADKLSLLKQTKLPVLFIIGKDDSAVPFEKSMEQSQIPAMAEVCILDQTGHMGMFEKKEESLKAVRDFVEKFKH
ncbi:MAG TPA: alpha/beta hydrolase [Cytophagaceae bacterium]